MEATRGSSGNILSYTECSLAKWPEDAPEKFQQLNLINWLQMAHLYCHSYSAEEQRWLKLLVQNFPDYSSAPREQQEIFCKIEAVVAAKKWDRNVSPDSGKLLVCLVNQLAPNRAFSNVSTKRKLFSSDSEGY